MKRRMQTLTFTAAVGLSLACGALAQPKDDAAPKVTKITLEPLGIGDLSHALNIRKIVGTYHLSEKVAKIRLKFIFFHAGEQVKWPSYEWGLPPMFTLGNGEGADSGKFALQIVDLDYLSIRDAKPNRHRLHVQVTLGNALMGSGKPESDIPKSTFDVTGNFCTQGFLPEYGKPNEVPLFAIIGGKSKGATFQSTPDALVKANPKADILIAVLELNP